MAQFTNQATISYTGGEAASNIVTGEITQAIIMTKTAAEDCYRQGDILTYVVSIRNTGGAGFTGLTLTDNLGEYAFGEGALVPLSYTGLVLYYVNGVLQPTPTVTEGPPFVIRGIDVPAGGSAVIVYRVRAGETAPLGEEAAITNRVTLTGGGLITPVEAEEALGACTGAAEPAGHDQRLPFGSDAEEEEAAAHGAFLRGAGVFGGGGVCGAVFGVAGSEQARLSDRHSFMK